MPEERKILLLGGTGQVGFELRRALAPLGDVIAPGRKELDLAHPEAVRAFLAIVRPDMIVNAAAWTAVDAAEDHPEAARGLNAILPSELAEYATRQDIPLVHYSSDYVYPGTGEYDWQETDQPAPLSTYGRTKLEGDEAVVQSGAPHLVFRTSWVYAARGRNFMNTMLRLGSERDSLKVVSDQVGAPTPARLIAEVTLMALHGRDGRPAIPSGVYHLAPRGEASWHGFAREIFARAATLGFDLAISPENVAPIPTRDWPTPARRPLNSRLSVAKLEDALGIQLPDWQRQLALTLEERWQWQD